MAEQKLNLTRDQLATFLKNFEQIKQFENLFSVVDTLQPIIGTDFEFAADGAQASANEALSLVSALNQAVELLALAPRSESGTIAPQNADNVDITGGKISGLNPALPVPSGGTGQSTFTNGQLLIGNTTGNTLTKATLTPGANITITNGTGSITIAVSGLGTMAFENVGASGSFTAAGGEVVTVVNGIITSIV